MPALRELQARFVAAVLHRDETGAGAWLEPDALGPSERLNIYRITARENFAVALEAAFPLLRSLCGDRDFRQMAWAYQQAHPSRAGNLFHVGEGLATYLESRLAGTPDADLIDAARLEWACQEALVAADPAEPLNLAALAAVPAEHQADLVFELHPSARLVLAASPVFDAWQALQRGTPPTDAGRPVTVPGSEPLLVLRRANGIELQRLPPDEFHWLAAVKACARLGELVGARPDDDSGDTGARLQRWAAQGVLTGFSVKVAS